jgi:hypothetical protein
VLTSATAAPVRSGGDPNVARSVALLLRVVLAMKGVAVGVPGFCIGVAAVFLIRRTVADGGAHPWIIVTDLIVAAGILLVLWFMSLSGRLMIAAAFGNGSETAFLERVLRIGFRAGIIAGMASVILGLLPLMLSQAKVFFWVLLALMTLPALLLPISIGLAQRVSGKRG